LRLKHFILIASCAFLLLASCGKKGNPVPKGLPVPRAINDLKGEVRDAVLLLSFSIPTKNMDGTDTSDLAGFRILKKCGGCATGFEAWKDISLTAKQGYTVRGGKLFTYDNDLREGFDYGYRVFPRTSKDVLGDGSNIFSIKWLEPPPAPTGVAVREEDFRVVLSWSPATGLVYNAYRWEDDVYPVAPLNASPLSTSQFVDSGLQNGKRYRYEVRAARVEGGVIYEGEGTTVYGTPKDLTAPMPPVGLKLEKKDSGVLATWVPNREPDLAGYNIYRMSGEKAIKRNEALIREPQFLDRAPGQEPYVSYYVTAVDTAGNESDRSQEVTIILHE
jgi:hypothetical protein